MNRRELLAAGSAAAALATLPCRLQAVPALANPSGVPNYRAQFRALRAQCGVILAFQMGSFFEFMDEDAPIVAEVLDICLTSRADPETGALVPLCGVPVASALFGTGIGGDVPPVPYLKRLASAGLAFAVAQQFPAGHRQYLWRIVATYDETRGAEARIGVTL